MCVGTGCLALPLFADAVILGRAWCCFLLPRPLYQQVSINVRLNIGKMKLIFIAKIPKMIFLRPPGLVQFLVALDLQRNGQDMGF